jgi:membrane associated rhomboid family serine protease
MAIPVRDQPSTPRPPVVTYALIAINVVVFLLGPLSGFGSSAGTARDRVCAETGYFYRHGAIPAELLANRPLTDPPHTVRTEQGPITCAAPDLGAKTPVLSVLQSLFLHGGRLHLIGNMLFLYVFGKHVEDRFGGFRFTLFYLLTGYASTYGFALTTPDSVQPLVGASGAIAGVLGAYLWLYPRGRVTGLVPMLFFLPLRLPAWVVLGSYFVMQWLYLHGIGVQGDAGYAYAAHLVGFAVGFGSTCLCCRHRPARPRRLSSGTLSSRAGGLPRDHRDRAGQDARGPDPGDRGGDCRDRGRERGLLGDR